MILALAKFGAVVGFVLSCLAAGYFIGTYTENDE